MASAQTQTHIEFAESIKGLKFSELVEGTRDALDEALKKARVRDRSFEVIKCVDVLEPEEKYRAQTRAFYAFVSGLVADCSSSLRLQPESDIDPVDATKEQLLKYPVMLLAGEATALSFDDFRSAVRENPLLRKDLLSHRVLIACEAAPQSEGTTRPGLDDFLSEQVANWEPEHWFDRLDAVDLLSIGSIRLKALRHLPAIHPTIVGDRFVAVQELHPKGAPKRQWLLRGSEITLEFCDYIRDEIEDGTYIRPHDAVDVLDKLYSTEVIGELWQSTDEGRSSEVPEDFSARNAESSETLVHLGYLSEDHRRLSDDGQAWLTNMSPYVSSILKPSGIVGDSTESGSTTALG